MRYQGRVTTWKDDQGYGFITPNDGGSQVFVHIKSFANRQRRPGGNELVTYECKVDAKGRTQAENVAFVGERMTSPAASGNGNSPLILASAFLVFVAGVTFTGRLPMAVLGLYLAASVLVFIAYAIDKSAAQNDQWRTKESTLHLFALVGGWPGALVAQRLFRHKTSKKSFQTVFWATVVLNCAGFGWLFSTQGAAMLQSFLPT
jgi:uncharacterized membrane protein YsdA (DUF1294 family)/cold shock CspA family protein